MSEPTKDPNATDGPPLNCLVSSAMARVQIDTRYGAGLLMVLNLLLKRAGGAVLLREAEAREFAQSGQHAKIEAYGPPEGEPTERGWRISFVDDDAAVLQVMTDIVDTLGLVKDLAQAKQAQAAQEATSELNRL